MNIIQPVHAVVDISNKQINPIAKFSTIASFTNILIPLFMIVAGILTLSMLLYAAFTYITSGGVAEKIKKAQSVFLYSIMGLFLIFFAYVITKVIGYIFHITMPL